MFPVDPNFTHHGVLPQSGRDRATQLIQPSITRLPLLSSSRGVAQRVGLVGNHCTPVKWKNYCAIVRLACHQISNEID